MTARPVHPAAAAYPLLPEDQLDSMAEDIAANGQRDPIIVTRAGVLIDGRNRLAACQQAGVEPKFLTVDFGGADKDFADEAEIEAFILSVNVEKRSLTNGQKAMFRAMSYARAGKRKAGRWERGTLDNGRSADISGGWLTHMKQAGVVLDVAARAAALGEDFAGWAGLPEKVRSGEVTLDAAHRTAQGFDKAAGLAEFVKFQPLGEWIAATQTSLEIDARNHPDGVPVVDAPLKSEHRKQLLDIAAAYTARAGEIRRYLKEAK